MSSWWASDHYCCSLGVSSCIHRDRPFRVTSEFAILSLIHCGQIAMISSISVWQGLCCLKKIRDQKMARYIQLLANHEVWADVLYNQHSRTLLWGEGYMLRYVALVHVDSSSMTSFHPLVSLVLLPRFSSTPTRGRTRRCEPAAFLSKIELVQYMRRWDETYIDNGFRREEGGHVRVDERSSSCVLVPPLLCCVIDGKFYLFESPP